MLRFSIDKSDADNADSRKIEINGIELDHEYGDNIWSEFNSRFPDFNSENPEGGFNSEAYKQFSIIEYEVYYIAKNIDPQTMRDAVKFITSCFYFLPIRLWINDKEYRMSEYAGEIAGWIVQ